MQQPEDHLAGEHALLAHGLAYGGQVGQLGERVIIDAYDRDFLRYPNSGPAQRAHGAEGHFVGVRVYGRGRLAQAQQLAHGLGPLQAAPVHGCDEAGISGNARFAQSRVIGLRAAGDGGPAGLAGVDRGDHGDAPVAEEDQVVHGLPTGRLVVDADVRIGGALAAGGHDADPHQLQTLLLGLGYRKREYHNRIHLAPGRKPLEESLPVRSVTDVVQEHIEVGLAQYRLERLEHGGEEPPGDVRYHHRNPLSRAAGQAGRFGRDHVGQFLGHG